MSWPVIQRASGDPRNETTGTMSSTLACRPTVARTCAVWCRSRTVHRHLTLLAAIRSSAAATARVVEYLDGRRQARRTTILVRQASAAGIRPTAFRATPRASSPAVSSPMAAQRGGATQPHRSALALVRPADEFVDAMEADFSTRPEAGSLFTEVLGMISVIERSGGCLSTTCSSPVRLRSAHWCSRPPRKTSFQ